MSEKRIELLHNEPGQPRIYRNKLADTGTFGFDILRLGLPSLRNGQVAFADWNGDGFMDIDILSLHVQAAQQNNQNGTAMHAHEALPFNFKEW